MLNTGPVIMQNAGRTLRDPLGVTAAFRGAPDFGDMRFFATPGSSLSGGYLNHPGMPAYGPGEDDPRDRYLDPRLSGIDPRNRAKAAQRLAQQQALNAAGSSATAQSLAQLTAQQRTLEMQGGGRGIPSAARGGYFRGPVRVHAGEMVQPTGDGGVEVVNPIDAQNVDEQFGAMTRALPGNQPADPRGSRMQRLVAMPEDRIPQPNAIAGPDDPQQMFEELRSQYDAKVRSGVAAAQPVGEGRFREVAGRDSYSPSGRGIEDRHGGGMGLRSHDEQMQGILDGSLHPDQATPEVQAAFSERWRSDPRWARQVQGRWREQQNPGVPVEQQQAAAAQFRAESEARMAAMTPRSERPARSGSHPATPTPACATWQTVPDDPATAPCGERH